MSIYITIDGGTTNTRINLVENKEITDSLKINVGIRMNMENEGFLKNEIRTAIKEILLKNNLLEKDIDCILASGMITSEFGLCHLEHINVPAGIDELHNSMKEVFIREISAIPFVFIRGVKSLSDNFEKTDIIRGEETELMGIMKETTDECMYIFPGSHSKIIKTDNKGRICDFTTMLTGEMIYALSQSTILKDSVDLSVENINSEYLLKGFDFCRIAGINKSLFKTRILKNVFGCSKEETYSFFIGIVLCGEIDEIIDCDAKTIVIGGKTQIREALALILEKRCKKNIVVLDENTVKYSTALGAVKIYERSKL